jgi:very-short-patch-repair endonuclease
VPTQVEIARQRITQVLKFLQGYHTLKTPPKRSLDEYGWYLRLDQLPRHPSLKLGVPQPSTADVHAAAGGTGGFVFRVERPKLTPCPPPPESLREWVVSGWDRLTREVAVIESRNSTVGNRTQTIRFDADASRVRAFAEWQKRREDWIKAERPAREANAIYENLYGLFGKLQGDAGHIQLWHGDGMLRATDTVGVVDHPVLLQRVELRFNPDVPEISIVEADDLRELSIGLLGSICDGDQRTLANDAQIAACEQELRQDHDVQAFDESATNRFLRRLVQGVFQTGKFIDSEDETSVSDGDITIRRRGVLFLAPRTRSVSEAITSALRRLEHAAEQDISKPFAKIVGKGLDEADTCEHDIDELDNRPKPAASKVPKDLLLTLAANREQKRVLRQLEQHGRVLVQGPPGTGKSHTIANLVGHFLAHGKSVLITSHTAKALRVVREKVVKELQPLCLSILADDVQSHEDIQSCIDAIHEKIGATSPEKLETEADNIGKAREALQNRLDSAKKELRQAIRDEYDDIIVGGQPKSPADAARQVRAGVGEHDWIPGSVSRETVLPLSITDFEELYQSNATLTPDDEAELQHELPRCDSIMCPHEFRETIKQIRELRQFDFRSVQDGWATDTVADPLGSEIKNLSDLISAVRTTLHNLDIGPSWWRTCVEDSLQGHDHAWLDLVNSVERVNRHLSETSAIAISKHVDLRIRAGASATNALTTFREIEGHLRRGGSLGWFSTLFRGTWRTLLGQVRVDGRRPSSAEDFSAIVATIERVDSRRSLQRRWNRQMEPLDCGIPEELQGEPERFCRQFITQIRNALEWHKTTGQAVEERIRNVGVRWDHIVSNMPTVVSMTPGLAQWRAVIDKVLPLLERRCQLIELKTHERRLAENLQRLRSFTNTRSQNSVIERLKAGAASPAPNDYELAWSRLQELDNKRTAYSRRQALLSKLEHSARQWALAIRRRQSPHGTSKPPGDLERAWHFRQWQQELDRRAATDIDQLQQDVNRHTEQLEQITRQYVDRRAWAKQRRLRYGTESWDALNNWVTTITTPGFVAGILAPQLRAQAREQLANGRLAVPVWIMPLARVMDSFDFGSDQFDIVIVDEASQCDVLGLLLLLLGKQVVVVGDDKQVSPSAVGMDLNQIQALITQHLKDIPNKQSYHGKASLYDFAKFFGNRTVCLLEHFRCVPEIIQFSNHLSYQGNIKVLRDGAEVGTRPLVVSHRVDGVYDGEKNEYEAEVVASLLVAATEQPEYKRLTMGVVSLVSSSGQADLIDLLLQRHLSEREYVDRRIICGSPSQFQGDERDVMFLSVVHSAVNGPLSLLRKKTARQRFNVAASRAKDQEWVVHSLNPENDLKPDDLRRRLIQHAMNPGALTSQLSEANQRSESGFERDVIRELTNRNFRLNAQWPVGAYRIDIVVWGEDDRKIAIECDGDRYHGTPEKIKEDRERQLMLERRGWRFIRIRSSQFYLNPDKTMDQVCQRLDTLGIRPIGPEARSPLQANLGEELRQRIVRRAEELRAQWKQEGDIEEEFNRVRAERRRRFTRRPRPATEPDIQSESNTPSESPAVVAPVANAATPSSNVPPPVRPPVNPPAPTPPKEFKQSDLEWAVLKIVRESQEPLAVSDVLNAIGTNGAFCGVEEKDIERALRYFLPSLMTRDAQTQRWSYVDPAPG